MSETLAQYSFLPWVRQGLGNEIIEPDTLGPVPANPTIERPEVLVKTTVSATKGAESKNETISRIVKIQGPGDVLGLNTKTIIRAHPKKGVANFETNNLCYVEFYEEDLPWRFTPAKASGNKLRPWLALIVLREDEFDRSSSGATPTPFISIKQNKLASVFSNEKDTYGLAHVHVLEDLGNGNSADNLKAKLAQNPDLALSRVICPRKLEFKEGESNEYYAFLIPAFETGRLAGMGEDTTTTPAQKASWTKADLGSPSHPVSYPYYYSWSFNVSSGGDFESLAEKLTARELPDNIGKREMDLANMGFGIEPTGANALGYVEGAMRHPDYVTANWPASGTALKNELKNILNISADLQDTVPQLQGTQYFYSPAIDEDPIISPPTYGKWHSGTFKLSSSAANWVHQLNLHPSHRAAAGLGVRVVQQHQEEFMEMAWEQIGQINEANQKIIESEMAKRVANSLVKRKINRMSELDIISTTGNTLDVLKLSSQETARKSLKTSKVPTALRSGAFLKVANNFTPTALMNENGVDGATQVLVPALLNRLNADEDDVVKISAAPKRSEPKNAMPVFTALNAINSVVLSPAKTFMQHLAGAIKEVGTGFTTNAVMAKLPSDFTAEQKSRATAILNAKVSAQANNEPDVDMLVKIEEEIFEERIGTAFDEGLYDGVKFVKSAPIAEPVLFDHAVILNNRIAFQESFTGIFTQTVGTKLVSPIFTRVVRAKLPQTFHLTILQKLNPFFNYQRKLNAFFAEELANQSKPIMAYPRFPIPMYDYLKTISADYIIPNISEIEPDTITLMEPNKKFIEAFLAGMNHEFSRELLWREFPTDMRGSYFRHFWEYDNNPSAEINEGETVEDYTQRILNYQELKADVKELHQWTRMVNGQKRLSQLGNNHTGGPSLVLLIKGELFRKYPNTLVYAQKAKFKTGDKQAPRELTDYTNEQNVQWPIITGSIEPDVYFFGFELTEEEVNGNRTNNPGWFFVLRERPGQISFGLDDLGSDPFDNTPPSWNDVTWEHINNNAAQKPKFLKLKNTNINLDPTGDANLPRNATWGASSSDMAYILYQSPILFARHASTMLKD